MSHSLRQRRGWLRMAVAGSLAMALTACGGGSTSGAAPVAAVVKGLDNPFFQTMQRG